MLHEYAPPKDQLEGKHPRNEIFTSAEHVASGGTQDLSDAFPFSTSSSSPSDQISINHTVQRNIHRLHEQASK